MFTEIFEPFPDAESVVTAVFTEENGKTRLTVTARYPSLEVRDMVLEHRHGEGRGHQLRPPRRARGGTAAVLNSARLALQWRMAGRECYHCKQWVEEGEEHDCWTTTEAALTQDLSEDLREAWERLRETAADFGEQRIYASHHSIMFARRSCYFFVRPKKSFLEVCVFLGRTTQGAAGSPRRPERRSRRSSTSFESPHRDQVEAPFTEWLEEAYELNDRPVPRGTTRRKSPRTAAKNRVTSRAPKRASEAGEKVAPTASVRL